MVNPIEAVREYVSDKVDAWKNKNDLALCNENPVLFELKWTGEHFSDLYKIAKEQGLGAAWDYDKQVTSLRHDSEEIKDNTPRLVTVGHEYDLNSGKYINRVRLIPEPKAEISDITQ